MKGGRILGQVEEIVSRYSRRHIASAALGVATDLLKSVRPLIFYDDRERPHIEGSGVLLRIEDYRFLLTAAHTLDCPHPLYLAGEKDAFNLAGPKYSTNPPQGKKRSEDKLDVAVLELATEYDEAIGDVRFLGVEDLDVDEQPQELAPSIKSKYLVLGYPSTGLERDPKRHVITPQPFIYTANPRPALDYDALGLMPSAHLVVEFDRRRVMSVAGQRTARNPKGISGGGTWRFDSLLSRDVKDRLVAINVEWHAGAKRLLWGTRIALVLEMIRKNYPHLSSSIPRSRLLKINVR